MLYTENYYNTDLLHRSDNFTNFFFQCLDAFNKGCKPFEGHCCLASKLYRFFQLCKIFPNFPAHLNQFHTSHGPKFAFSLTPGRHVCYKCVICVTFCNFPIEITNAWEQTTWAGG